MIEKVKLINDDDNQACIQKFKRIKRDYQDIGPAGKKNEAVLWKLLNESADRFFQAEKAKANNEIEIINTLFDDLKKEDCSIQNIKEQMRELSKTRKSPEFIKLQKAIKLQETKKLEAANAEKAANYHNLLSLLEAEDESASSINKDILKTLKKPLYINDKVQLNEIVVMLELIAQIEPPAKEKQLKQKLSLEMLQNKFSGKNSAETDIKDLLIGFINNLNSKKLNANEKKLWERVQVVIAKIAKKLP
jgi:hypothetical protein